MGKRIAVVGVGALGGYVGGWLAHTGEDVTLIDFWPENIETIRRNGLELDGVTPEEKITVKNAKTMHLTEMEALSRQKPIDIAFVSMKSYDTEWATALIKQYLAPDGFVVSLQNCLNEERIAGVVGWGKTVGMVASLISVDMFEPARIRRTVAKGGDKHTVFRVGEVHGRLTKRVEELRDMVGRIDSAKTTTNLWGERWSKLCQNGMKNGVSAATGLTGSDCDRNDNIRRFAIKLGGEAVRVGQALGYHIEKIGKMEPETLGQGVGRRQDGARRDRDDHAARLQHQSQPARRHPAPVDGPGHPQGPPHRDRVHERLHRRPRQLHRRARADPRQAHGDREEGRAQGSEGGAGVAGRLRSLLGARRFVARHGLPERGPPGPLMLMMRTWRSALH